jgi:hypothetical protein
MNIPFVDANTANRVRITLTRSLLYIDLHVPYRIRNVHVSSVTHHMRLQPSWRTQRDVRWSRKTDRRPAVCHAVLGCGYTRYIAWQ